MKFTSIIPYILICIIYLQAARKIKNNASQEGFRIYPLCNNTPEKEIQALPAEFSDFGCCSKNRRSN